MFKKGFFSGALSVILVVALSVSVFASTNRQNIEVIYNNIKINVKGNNIEFSKDSRGNKIEPFIYNGTTYLPVKAISESLKLPVEWDGKTQTVYIDRPNTNKFDKSIYDMDYFTFRNFHPIVAPDFTTFDYDIDRGFASLSKYTGFTSNTGKTYQNATCVRLVRNLNNTVMGADVSYLSNLEYSKLQGTFVLDDKLKTENDVRVTVKIFLDDSNTPIYESPLMKNDSLPVDFNVDVKNAIKVTFRVEQIGMSNNWEPIGVGIVNAGFNK